MRSADRDELVSWIGAALAFLLALGFGAVELRSRLYANELVARNEGEKTLSLLMSVSRAVRDRNDEGRSFPEPPPEGPVPEEEGRTFAAAIESHQPLKERIRGVGLYAEDGTALYRYGSAPDALPSAAAPGGGAAGDDQQRRYAFRPASRSVTVQHALPIFRKRADRGPGDARPKFYEERRPTVWYELAADDYFARNAVAWAAFGAWVLAAAAAILLLRRTLRKNAHYREALRAQSELVALGTAARTLAHEIKNPLSAILLQAELASRLCPKEAERELAGIVAETRRIQLLVDRIGDFLREPAGSPEPIVLADFVSGVLLRAGPGGGAVPVSAADGAAGLAVRADAARLRSVVENLARNAYDAGGDPEEVAALVREEGSRAILEVADRGAGIPEDIDPERLFDPFFTTKTRGFGLGLALCRRFVEAAGGSIELVRRDGGGTVARVSLPKAAS